MTIQELVEKYKYKKLPKELSEQQREYYLSQLPSEFCLEGDFNCELYDLKGNKISNGYNRIVIGDYGAFIEIDVDHMLTNNLKVASGQEYRFTERYKNVKYHWYCLKNNEDIKIYYQRHTVSYADYKIDMFYIAPDEVNLKKF
jgi:hypothetical protein